MHRPVQAICLRTWRGSLGSSWTWLGWSRWSPRRAACHASRWSRRSSCPSLSRSVKEKLTWLSWWSYSTAAITSWWSLSGFSTSGPVTSATLAGVLSRALVWLFGLHYCRFVIQIIVANFRILLTFSENDFSTSSPQGSQVVDWVGMVWPYHVAK